MTSVRIRAVGRVQGVGYRAFVEREALRLGLSGWARNCADGTVEAVIAGEAAAVEAMLAAMRRGPTHARVNDLSVEPSDPPPPGFAIRPTL
ncbi:MAG: acylphosphatase [Rhizobiales bacterium]|nr:acylphosphatase [Hyphomicrobiales bacterium]